MSHKSAKRARRARKKVDARKRSRVAGGNRRRKAVHPPGVPSPAVPPATDHTPEASHVGKDGLTPAQRTFCLRYLSNGFNDSKAYREAYPDCRTELSARTAASRLLSTSVNVRRFLDDRLETTFEKLTLDADRALFLLSCDATADMRLLFDEKGKLLKPHLWPDEIARSVKAIKPGPKGTSIILNDSLKARELLAIAGGKLRQAVDHRHTFDHAAYLADEAPKT